MGKVGDWFILLLYVAALFLLVRPGSKGPTLIDSVTKGVARMVNSATGGGGWGKK
jgi:hypothetical protein